MILAPVVAGRKGEQADLFDDLRAQGFVRAAHRRQGARARRAAEARRSTRKHTIEVVVDRLKVRADAKQRLAESFETALRHADGRAVAVEIGQRARSTSSRRKFACPVCGYSLPELEPRLFSFNNPLGACPAATAWARSSSSTRSASSRIPNLSLASGAIKRLGPAQPVLLPDAAASLAAHYGFDLEQPFGKLPDERAAGRCSTARARRRSPFSLPERARPHASSSEHAFEGMIPNLERRYTRDRLDRGARGAREVPQHQALPGLRGHAAAARGAPRAGRPAGASARSTR